MSKIDISFKMMVLVHFFDLQEKIAATKHKLKPVNLLLLSLTKKIQILENYSTKMVSTLCNFKDKKVW